MFMHDLNSADINGSKMYSLHMLQLTSSSKSLTETSPVPEVLFVPHCDAIGLSTVDSKYGIMTSTASG